ncbi:MAG: hypothetical protein J6U61_01640 [Lachnospiraceae bacterium]|nr:hypothetical protein [Lachnospiraceae bacterium]
MAETTVTIKYWISGEDEYPLYYREGGTQKGAWAEFLKKLEDAGVHAEYVKEHDGAAITAADAIDLLQRGELDMIPGMPAELIAGKEDTIAASGVIYRNELTAVIKKGDPEVPADSVDSCYWGIEQAYLALTEGTALDGHTLDFNTRKEMYAALKGDSIYGALIKRSSQDYEAYVGGRFSFEPCPVIAVPYGECVFMRADGGEINGLINEICDELAEKYLRLGYEKEHGADGTAHSGTEAGYAGLLAKAYDTNSVLTVVSCAGVAGTLVFGIMAAALSAKHRKHKKLERVKLASFAADNPAKELYELDIKKQELYAYDNFAVFGSVPADIPNPVSLKLLSTLLGYDFTAHFADVTPHCSTIYHNRLIIHVGGKKMYLAEDGHRVGDVLYFAMTNVREA